MSAKLRTTTVRHRGLLTIHETPGGGCFVTYETFQATSPYFGEVQHWGEGDGGYEATVERFVNCPCWNENVPQTRGGWR